MNYINEFDPHAAAWCRQLVEMKLIPPAVVDERSICDVSPSDLAPYTQCHFFGGISGWPLALQRAGVPATRKLWSASLPCQPWSCAGDGEGEEDERHLFPVFLELVKACRPGIIIGEQVSSAKVVGRSNKPGGRKVQGKEPLPWFSGVRDGLEQACYAVCGLDIPAACAGQNCEIGVLRGGEMEWQPGILGPPHIRQRLYWFAIGPRRLSDARRGRLCGRSGPGEAPGPDREAQGDRSERQRGGPALGNRGAVGGLSGPQCDAAEPRRSPERPAEGAPEAGAGTHDELGRRGHAGGLHHPGGARLEGHPGGARLEGHPGGARLEGHPGNGDDGDRSRRDDPQQGGPTGEASGDDTRGLPDADGGDAGSEREQRRGEQRLLPGRDGHVSDWTDFEFVPCLDGKSRRVKPGILPLVAGLPRGVVPSCDPCLPGYAENTGEARRMRLSGYGNAINIELATEFIMTCMEVIDG